jgi:hypothetical protein
MKIWKINVLSNVCIFYESSFFKKKMKNCTESKNTNDSNWLIILATNKNNV